MVEATKPKPAAKERPAVKIMEGLQEALAVAKGEAEPYRVHVGRPASGKVVVSIRLDPEVIAKFRATGAGWQARMNEALKAAKI